MYFLHTLRFLCTGFFKPVRARLKAARDVFQLAALGAMAVKSDKRLSGAG